MRGRIWKILGNQFRRKKKQVAANRYLSALGNRISILSYFQMEEGCGEHLASTFNALVSG